MGLRIGFHGIRGKAFLSHGIRDLQKILTGYRIWNADGMRDDAKIITGYGKELFLLVGRQVTETGPLVRWSAGLISRLWCDWSIYWIIYASAQNCRLPKINNYACEPRYNATLQYLVPITLFWKHYALFLLFEYSRRPMSRQKINTQW